MTRIRSAFPLSALAFALVLASPLQAATLPLSFTADTTSRWYDFYVGHFAQADRSAGGTPPPSIMYDIEAEANPFAPTVYQATGVNRVVFANGRAFANIGSLTYNGSGDGTFPVTAITLDVATHVRSDTASALGTTYTTTVSSVSGTITIAGGAPTSIDVSAAVRFTMDASFIPPLTTIPFDGTLAFAGDRFDIFVDDDYDFGHGILHNAWDLTGSIDGVGTNDIVFVDGFD